MSIPMILSNSRCEPNCTITHEVILSNSRCELKITGFGGFHEEGLHSGGGRGDNGGAGSAFEGTLRPGTPGPGVTKATPIAAKAMLYQQSIGFGSEIHPVADGRVWRG
ncbi:C2H2-type domain-containing protein [Forsythia ovata]|uniref:C2H2-type domain-containing protein n=1 Tax=Forsythia ovata TaxID=205694 RepID=A0ABD1TNS6_9LAMI